MLGSMSFSSVREFRDVTTQNLQFMKLSFATIFIGQAMRKYRDCLFKKNTVTTSTSFSQTFIILFPNRNHIIQVSVYHNSVYRSIELKCNVQCLTIHRPDLAFVHETKAFFEHLMDGFGYVQGTNNLDWFGDVPNEIYEDSLPPEILSC